MAAARILGVDANELYPQLVDRRKHFVRIERFADPKQAAKLAKRGYAGVGFYSEEQRTYPQRTVGSQIVGFAGDDNKGLSGIEVAQDRALAGTPGQADPDPRPGRPARSTSSARRPSATGTTSS